MTPNARDDATAALYDAPDPKDPKGPETDAAVEAVVKHTDSGSGASQGEHWAPNVDDAGRDEAAKP